MRKNLNDYVGRLMAFTPKGLRANGQDLESRVFAVVAVDDGYLVAWKCQKTKERQTRLRKGLCPECGTELATGFGLAGGGYGAYTYCPNDDACGQYFHKTQMRE